MDDFTRECLGLVADTSLSGRRVARETASRRASSRQWLRHRGEQNGFVESFNGRFRDECLNEHLFSSLAAARQIIEAWRIDRNTERPHTSPDGLTPAAFATRPQPGHAKEGLCL